MNRLLLLLGTVAMSVATVVGMVIMHEPTPSDPFSSIHLSAPSIDPATLATSEAIDSPYVSYKSDSIGYSLRYPATWSLDDSRATFSGDIISDADQRVIVTISATPTPAVSSQLDILRMTNTLEESLTTDDSFTPISVQRLVWKNLPALFSDGMRVIGNQPFHTRTYNIFRSTKSDMLTISISSQEESEVQYEEVLSTLLKSLKVDC